MERYETFKKRFWAAFMDGVIVYLMAVIIIFFFTFFTSKSLGQVIYPPLLGFISVSYFIVLHSVYGQTLGKMALKIKILDISEKPITFGQAVLRNLPQLILVMFTISFSTADNSDESVTVIKNSIYSFLAIFFVINVVISLFNDKDRALHDFIAGTVVVRTDI